MRILILFLIICMSKSVSADSTFACNLIGTYDFQEDILLNISHDTLSEPALLNESL